MKMFKILYQHETYLLRRNALFPVICTFLFLLPFLFLMLDYPLDSRGSPLNLFSIISRVQFFILPYLGILGFSHEKLLKTHWTLLSWPISSYSIIYVKICAWIQIILIGILTSLFWIICGYTWFNYDFALIVSGILQIILTSLLSLSLVIFFSVIMQNPWSSVVMSQVCFFIWMLSDFFISMLPQHNFFIKILYSVNYHSHSKALENGIINSGTIIFFLGLTAFFIYKSYTGIEKLRGKHIKALYMPLLICTGICAIIFPYKLDITLWGTSRLHPFSKKIVKELKNPLYITYYSSAAHAYDPGLTAIWHHLKSYEKLSKWIVVKHKSITDSKQAESLGLYNYANYLSGAFIEYENIGSLLPFLHSGNYNNTEYLVTQKIHQILTKRKPSIILRTGPYQKFNTYNALIKSLKEHFDIHFWNKNSDLPEGQGLMILSAASLNAQDGQQIAKAHEQGRGVFIGYSGMAINTDDTISSQSYESLQIDEFFKQRGVTKGSQLILDPEGAILPSQNTRKKYPAWPKGFHGKSPLWQMILPIFSTALWADSRWDSLLLSSPQSSLQEKPIILDPSRLLTENLAESSGPYTIAIQEKNSKTPFIVIGSETLFSDIFPEKENIIMAELLAWHLVGLPDMANLKLKKIRRAIMKRPYSEIGNIKSVNLQIAVFLIGNCILIIFLRIKRKRKNPNLPKKLHLS